MYSNVIAFVEGFCRGFDPTFAFDPTKAFCHATVCCMQRYSPDCELNDLMFDSKVAA